jgi:hypothetical protein
LNEEIRENDHIGIGNQGGRLFHSLQRVKETQSVAMLIVAKSIKVIRYDLVGTNK